MARHYRMIRAAAAALLIAVALGAGGTTGMASALGAHPPANVETVAGAATAPDRGILATTVRFGGGRTPPTHAPVIGVSVPDRLGPALALGFLIGLIVSGLLLVPRPGSRGRG